MKISANREALAKVVNKLSSVVEDCYGIYGGEKKKKLGAARSTLSYLKLEALHNQGVFVCAANKYVFCRHLVNDCRVDREGACLLSPEKISVVLAESTYERIEIESEESTEVRLVTDAAEFKDMTHDVYKFPTPKLDNGEFTCTVAAKDLLRQIGLTKFAAARGGQVKSAEYRFHATAGIEFTVGQKTLKLTATNGSHAATAEASAKLEGALPKAPHVLAAQTLDVMCRQAGDGDIAFSPTGGMSHFFTDSWRVVGPLVEGKFPSDKAFWPEKTAGKASTTAGPLRLALSQAAVFGSGSLHRLTLNFTNGNKLIISACEVAGRSRVELPIEVKKEFAADYDARCLLGSVEALAPDDVVTILYGDKENQKRLVLSADGYRYVIVALADKDADKKGAA